MFTTELYDQSLVIYLDNKKTHNAFSVEMAEGIKTAISEQKPKSIILCHKGPIFCAGGDLKFYAQQKTKEEGLATNDHIRSVLKWLTELPVPKACFINGACFGGGIELASCFDHIVASPKALFGLWQRRIGLSFGWGGGERLLDRIDKAELYHWLQEASTKDVYSCRDLGLIDQIALSHQGIEFCVDWCNSTLKWGGTSFKMNKTTTFKKEQESFSRLWWEKEHQQVLKKFK